jgi:hypothetical protein
MDNVTDKEVLLDLLLCLASMVHSTLDGLAQDVLCWQPDKEANNIAVTVWHFSRAFDVFKVRLFENQPATEELWHRCGWAAKTGYDPRGIGWGGFGNLAGYSRQEVEAVPALAADELLTYFKQVYDALREYLSGLPAAALYEPAVGWSDESRTVYELLRALMIDSLGHLGEIRAIKAMWERKARSSQQEVERTA